jgi:uncharacterized membrane protein YjgN (DUF898 family)
MPTIHCPQCSYHKDTAPAKIPQGHYRIICPLCGHTFFPQPAPIRTVSQPQASDEIREIPFTFHGRAGEYFGIWIVNTLLKILTLGFYSPWAKVRKRRYLYGNTRLDNHAFDYLANPWVLFRGFVIGAILLVAYSLLGQLNPLFSLLFTLAFFLATPWLVVRSRMFNNRNTSHRNLRFSFAPEFRESYLTFGLLPILTTATLGLAAPYVLYRQKRFLMENNRFGQTPFTFEATVADYYRIFLRMLGLFMLISMVMTAIGYAASQWLLPLVTLPEKLSRDQATLMTFGAMLFFIVFSMMASLYLYVRLSNLNWQTTHLGGHYFDSRLSVRKMGWIVLGNLFAIGLSAGLLVPWATIRLTRYRLECLSLVARGPLDHFLAGQDEEVSAIGEEIGDIFDMDFGI